MNLGIKLSLVRVLIYEQASFYVLRKAWFLEKLCLHSAPYCYLVDR